MESVYLISAVFLVLNICILALAIWFVFRFINLMDDVRYLSDVAKKEHPDVPYRHTSSLVIVGVIAIPLAVFFSAIATSVAFIASMPNILESLYLIPVM